MSKPYVSDRAYLAKASILKKFGLIDYPLTKNLTAGQKSHITKLTAKHFETATDKNGNTKRINKPPLRSLIENPELFKTRKVNKKDAAKWKSAGYKVINNRVIVRGEKGAKIKVNKGSITLERKHITEQTKIYGNLNNFLKAAKKLFSKKLKKGEYVMFGIGRYGIFHRKFLNYDDLENYVNDLMERMGIDEEGDEIQMQLIIGGRK
jgi:hypothetical protein